MLSAFYVVLCFFVCASCSFDSAPLIIIIFCLWTRFILVSARLVRGCRVCALIYTWRRPSDSHVVGQVGGGFAALIFVTCYFHSSWWTSSVVIHGRVYGSMSVRAFRRLALVGLFFFYSFFGFGFCPFVVFFVPHRFVVSCLCFLFCFSMAYVFSLYRLFVFCPVFFLDVGSACCCGCWSAHDCAVGFERLVVVVFLSPLFVVMFGLY